MCSAPLDNKLYSQIYIIHFIYYSQGGIGLVWSIIWFFVVFDSPAQHPRISPEERKEIEDAIGTSTSKKRPSSVPWKRILTSPPVWAIIITHGASVFGYFTVVNQLPTYMKYILDFKIKEVSIYITNLHHLLITILNINC